MTAKRSKLTLTLLTLTFVVPILAAWLTFSKGLFLSGHTVHHGILLQPSISIATLHLQDETGAAQELKGKWWLMYLTERANNPLSERNLYYMRQIRQATGKDRDRIERAIVTVEPDPHLQDALAKKYPNTVHFTIPQTNVATLESDLPKELALRRGSLYIVDPHGNIMLFYAPDAAPKGILKDLQRLLKVSQIG